MTANRKHKFCLAFAIYVAGTAIGYPQDQSPLTSIQAGFDYQAYPRYGIDRNANGIIDIPNSLSYVQNTEGPSACPLRGDSPQFKIRLLPTIRFPSAPCPLATPTALPHGRFKFMPPSSPSGGMPGLPDLPGVHGQTPVSPGGGTNVWPPNTDVIPPEGCLQAAGKALVCNAQTAGSPSSVREHLCRDIMAHSDLWVKAPQRSFLWSVSDADGNLLDTFNRPDSGAFDVCLPQGNFTAKLQYFDGSSEGYAVLGEFPLSVRDILIVGLGDSFGSGEGNPDISSVAGWKHNGKGPSSPGCASYAPIRQVYWADDGSTIFNRRVVSSGHCKTKQPIWSVTGASAQFQDHQAAHRSSRAASSLVALALEELDSKTSVTYIGLASTGARITLGVATPTILEGRQLESQLLALKHLIGTRKVDALQLSVGGNDIGFGNVIEALIAREYFGPPVNTNIGPEMGDVWIAVQNGQWADLENKILSVMQSSLAWGNDRVGLNGLGSSFEYLNSTIIESGIAVGAIYLTEYPTSLQTSGGTDPKYCDAVLTDVATKEVAGITFKLEIGGAEVSGVTENVVNPLNDILRNKTVELDARNGSGGPRWIHVGGIRQASESHGLCVGSNYAGPYAIPAPHDLLRIGTTADVRWFRRGKESSSIQGPFGSGISKGIAHPNEMAHKNIACITLRNMYIDGLGWKPIDRINSDKSQSICR